MDVLTHLISLIYVSIFTTNDTVMAHKFCPKNMIVEEKELKMFFVKSRSMSRPLTAIIILPCISQRHSPASYQPILPFDADYYN